MFTSFIRIITIISDAVWTDRLSSHRYDWKYVEKKQLAEEVLASRAGVSCDYVTLLVALCQVAGLRVKRIHGYVRGRDYK